MLAENLAWKKQDCSKAAWEMLKDLWPELRLAKWFHRTNCETMASWPWPPLMNLSEADFGDLLFANSNDDKPELRSDREKFLIKHVMVHWDEPGTAVHASSKQGFSKTRLKPYWEPRINLAIRPPY
jgi:hypothetical protein